MEEKIPSKNVTAMEKNCDKHTEEIKVTEKWRSIPLKEEKTHGVELQNSVQSVTANKEQDFGKLQSVKTNKNRVLKRKMTEDGVTIERVLSEGEASSGFETVSSISSDLDLEDFQLSSSDDESDYNVIVRIENELAYQQSKNSGWRKQARSNGEIRYNSEAERLLCNYSGQRHGIVRSYKQSLHWRRLCNGAFQKYDWTDSWSRADDDSRHSRRTSSDREWSRFSDYSIRSRESRCVDQSKRYRGSLYTDDVMGKSKKKKKTAIHRENSEPKYELIGSKSLSYEIIRKESKHSTSFEKSKSGTKRILQNTKQTISSSSPQSSSTSIWKRLDGGRPHKKFKKDEDRSSGSPSANKPRKKERTPFLVELERKLKKAEKQTSVELADSGKSDQNKTQNCVTKTAPGPTAPALNAAASISAAVTTTEAALIPATVTMNTAAPMNEAALIPATVTMNTAAPMNEAALIPATVSMNTAAPMNEAAVGSPNLNYVQTSSYAYSSYNSQLYSSHYASFPTLSTENLPLVPGPSGLPVHITQTGEHIFHDMDGRRIPIGLNGYYLPLDPAGRLFPHIVSPGNQAIPIHITEDGVLRLPNGDPVPVGFPHNLPVNIDGSIIYIGPDSRPLGHYPNLPRQPSIHVLQMTQCNSFGNGQTEIQGGTSMVPQVCQTGNEKIPEIQERTLTVPQICHTGNEQAPEIQGGTSTVPQVCQTGNKQTPENQDGTLTVPQVCQTGNEQTPEIQERTLTVPQVCGNEQTPEIQGGLAGQYSSPSSNVAPASSQSVGQSSSVHTTESDLLNSFPNSWEKTNRDDVLKNYQRRARQRQEDLLKCIEIQKTLGVSPSKGGVKRSTPMKLSQKRTSRDENDDNYILTDSNESKPAGDLKSSLEENKDKKQRVESNTEDLLVVKIRKVLKSLDDNKFKPPALGRFIIPEALMDVLKETSPNESPLMKNRVKLSFLTPNTSKFRTPSRESEIVHEPNVGKASVVFSFLSREKSSDRPEKVGQPVKKIIKNFVPAKLPVFTFDSAVQCDLTSNELSKLNTKIVELEKEVVRLRNINANLLDGFRNVQEANEKKSDELGKALLDIEKRNCEILTLKRLLNEKRRG